MNEALIAAIGFITGMFVSVLIVFMCFLSTKDN